MKKQYIQIGVTALRAPNGEFLPSVPLYIEVEGSADLVHPLEKQAMQDVSGIFAERYQNTMRLQNGKTQKGVGYGKEKGTGKQKAGKGN